MLSCISFDFRADALKWVVGPLRLTYDQMDNPVEAGFVNDPYHWKYSSAINYSGGKGLLEIDYV